MKVGVDLDALRGARGVRILRGVVVAVAALVDADSPLTFVGDEKELRPISGHCDSGGSHGRRDGVGSYGSTFDKPKSQSLNITESLSVRRR